MGILTIGLLGVASVFPVGSFYMQKGEIADRGSAIAQAAFNDALVRGTLNPEKWLTFEDGAGTAPTTNQFTRPYARRMRDYRAWLLASTFPPEQIPRRWELEAGAVYVIDPIGIASIIQVQADGLPATEAAMRVGSVFPSTRHFAAGIPGNVNAQYPWHPWSDQWNLGPRWPIRRMTFVRPTAAVMPLDPTAATELFGSTDDLSLDPPNAQDKPTVQPWRLVNDGGNQIPLSRMSRGNYSWMITVAPTSSEARNAIMSGEGGHSYEVSTVVFFKRPIATTSPTSPDERLANVELLQRSERSANAKIVSTGLSGGEVLLEKSGNDPLTDSPFANLKTGNWIMLCGPHPNSTNERPMMVSRWYKVLAIEGKDEKLDNQGRPGGTDTTERRLVSLRGPQWPWQPANSVTDNALSNSLYVCIPTGAVAVHSKTIRLEGNSVHNGGVNSLTSK